VEINPDLRHILSAALRAPSGDNNQPWRWVVRRNGLELWYVPDENASEIFAHADQLSLGASLESACIAASEKGLRADVSLNPSQDSLHKATISLVKDGSIVPDILAQSIYKRITNRLPFSKKPPSAIERSELKSAVAQASSRCTIHLIADRTNMGHIARAATVYDELLFSHKTIHENFFKRINWTQRQDRTRRTGFYYPTLGTPPHVELLFRLLCFWPLQRALDLFGFPTFVAWHNRQTYLCAGAFGALSMPGHSSDDYFEAGRALMRLWLAVTRLGLSLQPVSGVLYLDPSLFSGEQRKKTEEALEVFAREFQTNDPLVFAFRVGRSRRHPRFQTTRKRFEDVVHVEI
jgi:nitroreductase